MGGEGTDLEDRVRDALASRSVREVAMFGGLSFMVDDRMVVAVRRGGDLLVRIDPADADELRGRPGARPAEMGTGRSMGRGWISVGGDTVRAPEELLFWLDTALAYHRSQAPGAHR